MTEAEKDLESFETWMKDRETGPDLEELKLMRNAIKFAAITVCALLPGEYSDERVHALRGLQEALVWTVRGMP